MRLDFSDDEPVIDPWEAAAATIRGELEARTGQREQIRLRRLPFRTWAQRAPEPRGPLDFNRFTWQRELYDHPDDREAVYMKGTQVGVSTWAIRWALYHADVHQRVCLYTFPTETELSDFSRQRMTPVIRASDYLRSRMPSEAVNNVGLKQLGTGGWIYFRGTNKPIDSVNADVVVFDEYDTSDQANIEASERRVTGPDSAGLIRRVGVPSIPGFGISGLYDGSDQRVWTVRCDCGHWNPMRGFEAFQANVDRELLALVCAECHRGLDVRAGEWVPTYPDRPVRGYHIPKLLVPGLSLSTLIANSEKSRPDQVEAFHTRDLGEPYAPAEGRLSIEAVRACVRQDLRPQPDGLVSYNLTTMGVDMASSRALNVVIEDEVDHDSGTGRKVWVGTVEDDSERTAFQRLCWLMDAFNVNMCGIDNEPDGRFSRAFAARFPGRVYRMDFFTPQAGGRQEAPNWHVRDDEQFCSLYRTRAYDATFERFRLQRVLLPPLEMLPQDYPEHLGNLYRRKVELPGNTGAARVEYVRTGPEDYAQCEAYNLAAIELYWRNYGLQETVGSGPRPLVDEIEDFVPLDLSTYGATYRPGAFTDLP